MDENKKSVVNNEETDVNSAESAVDQSATEHNGDGVEETGIDTSADTSADTSSDISEDTTEDNYHAVFEALLFLSNEPLSLNFFTKNFKIDKTDVKIVLDSLIDEYEERDGGIKLVEISNGYQFVTNPNYARQIRRILGFKRKEPLTRGMLETLSIIAYKQPVILAEVEELRGVSSRMMVANLMKRNLIKPVGRKEVPGRPLAYGTTDEFLRVFGLNKLSDLPKLSEIKEFSYETDFSGE
ncbi:MAG: SMC-Scp complex subunit ScpB [Spirochaetes bacterium]|nr:SMC-Scp complex subunit ScpB [Spirochaetota bacterium]MBN2770452.1 SMC-Scp complex subunit ScpB [Spirochaetota bacterium]